MYKLLSTNKPSDLPCIMILERPDGTRLYACVFAFSRDRAPHDVTTDPHQQYVVHTATTHLHRDIQRRVADPHSTVEVVHLSRYSTTAGPRSWAIYTRIHCYANDL